MTIPVGPVPVPDVVTELAAGRPVHPVWRSGLGGLTFRIGGDIAAAEYVKTGPGDFAAEATRLRWARRYTAVPVVLGIGADWLHTAALPGWSAVDPRWMADPGVAARAIGAGLRQLHDALPVPSCPFDWSVSTRLAGIAPDARTALAEAPTIDRLVVCHGDACAPNTLIDADGRCCGHVDLDSLGVADRWADLAVATMSLEWNYPAAAEEQLQGELLAAYDIAADVLRIDYYRRLWNAAEIDGG